MCGVVDADRKHENTHQPASTARASQEAVSPCSLVAALAVVVVFFLLNMLPAAWLLLHARLRCRAWGVVGHAAAACDSIVVCACSPTQLLLNACLELAGYGDCGSRRLHTELSIQVKKTDGFCVF